MFKNKKGFIQWIFIGVAGMIVVVVGIIFKEPINNKFSNIEGKPCVYKSFDFGGSACVNGINYLCDNGRITKTKCLYGCGAVSGSVYDYMCVFKDKPFIRNTPLPTILTESEANPLNKDCDSSDDDYCYQGNAYHCKTSIKKFGKEQCTHGACEEFSSGAVSCPLKS